MPPQASKRWLAFPFSPRSSLFSHANSEADQGKHRQESFVVKARRERSPGRVRDTQHRVIKVRSVDTGSAFLAASKNAQPLPSWQMAGFLTEIHVTQYACLKDVKTALTPLHAFIGPNDSGKSTLLRVIQSVFAKDGYPGSLHVFARFIDRSDLRIHYKGTPGVQVSLNGSPQILDLAAALQQKQPPSALSVRVATGEERAQLVRLSTDELRRPSQLIPYGTQLVLQDGGRNIAGLYDAVRDRAVERFTAISKQVMDLFPTVKALGLRAKNSTEKVLAVTLVDGTEVLSDAMSEGLLYYLAFAVLAELQRPAVYLVEEPENGLHPSRIADIVRMLRAVAEDEKSPVQVLMATHSPLVVNELRPEEVTVVTRDPATGTKLRGIKSTPHFEERSRIYALGELWLSYADGTAEAPLFDEKEQ
jgi:predicted ATPase